MISSTLLWQEILFGHKCEREDLANDSTCGRLWFRNEQSHGTHSGLLINRASIISCLQEKVKARSEAIRDMIQKAVTPKQGKKGKFSFKQNQTLDLKGPGIETISLAESSIVSGGEMTEEEAKIVRERFNRISVTKAVQTAFEGDKKKDLHNAAEQARSSRTWPMATLRDQIFTGCETILLLQGGIQKVDLLCFACLSSSHHHLWRVMWDSMLLHFWFAILSVMSRKQDLKIFSF